MVRIINSICCVLIVIMVNREFKNFGKLFTRWFQMELDPKIK